MRKLRYGVATSLDGFIAGPRGEYDWIVMDPSIDFAAIYREFDTMVMGRKTFDVTRGQGEGSAEPSMRVVVFSRTLPPRTKGGLTVTDQDPVETVAALKKEEGKDIWLFGGGELFRTLLDAGLVDAIEIAIMPVLVGGGVPLVAPGRLHGGLRVTKSETLPSGILMVSYEVARGTKKTKGPRRHEGSKKTKTPRRHEGTKKKNTRS